MTRSRSCSPCARPTRASKASPPSPATSRWTVRPRTPGVSSRWPGPIRCRRSPPAPLKWERVTAHQVEGQDGLGNLERFVEPDGRPRYPEPSPAFEMRSGPEVILDAADRWGAELTIVALGPLTNLALALQQDA